MAAVSSLSHSFSPQLAHDYGIEEAILINYFQHWITKNRIRDRNFHDGRTWMYETQEDMAANFVYMNHFKVFRAIKSLIKQGVLISGNYNKNRYDRTQWYAFVDEQKFIGATGRLQKCNIDVSTSQNGDFENATPIPVTVPITITDTYSPSVPEGEVSLSSSKKKKRVLEEKKERDSWVYTTPTQHANLLKKAGGDEDLVNLWYAELSKWKIGKERPDGDDYLKILKWVVDACKKPNGPKTLQDDQKLLDKLKEYADKTPALQIDCGANYVAFRRMGNVEYKVGEPGFQEKVKSALRKMNVPVN